MPDRNKTRVQPSGGKYTPPSGPSISRMKERLGHSSRLLMGILLVTIMVTSVVFFAGGPFGGGGGPGAGQRKDDVVARVNDDTVLRSELERNVAGLRQMQQMFGQPGGIARDPELYGQAVSNLIQGKVELEAARQSHIKVADSDIDNKINEEVNQAFQQEKGQYENDKVFNAFLKNNNLTEADYKARIRDELFTQNENRGVDVRALLSDQLLLEKYRDEQQHKLVLPRALRYSQIVLSNTPKPGAAKPGSKADKAAHDKADADAKKLADTIMQQLKAGGDFAKLAKQYSTDTASKDKGGDAGWVVPDSSTGYTPDFLKGVGKSKVGDLLGPLKSFDGYHVVKVTGEATSLPAKPDPTTDSPLVQAANSLYQKKLEAMVKTARVVYQDSALAGAVLQSENHNPNDPTVLADYRKALAEKNVPDSEKGWAAYAVAESLLNSGKAKDSLPLFAQAVKFASGSGQAYLEASKAAFKAGDKALALNYARKGVRPAAGDVSTLQQLQVQLMDLGDKDAAAAAGKEFMDAAKAHPANMFGGPSAPIRIGGAAGGGPAIKMLPSKSKAPAGR